MLNLNELDTDDIPGITRVKGNDLAQAGAVCLELQGHQQGVRLIVRGRMEVSGIRAGNDRQVRARMQQKLQQTDRSNVLGLPAYVIVVEFSRPLAEIGEQRNEQS